MHTKQTLVIYIPVDQLNMVHHTLTHTYALTHSPPSTVCYQEMGWDKKEKERGEINWCSSPQENERSLCIEDTQSSSVAAVYFWHTLLPHAPPQMLPFWDFPFFSPFFYFTTRVIDIRFALSKAVTNVQIPPRVTSPFRVSILSAADPRAGAPLTPDNSLLIHL